jgi:hypothetical protein
MDAYAETNLVPTVKYGGGSLMLWDYSASTSPGALVKLNGIMNIFAMAISVSGLESQ